MVLCCKGQMRCRIFFIWTPSTDISRMNLPLGGAFQPHVELRLMHQRCFLYSCSSSCLTQNVRPPETSNSQNTITRYIVILFWCPSRQKRIIRQYSPRYPIIALYKMQIIANRPFGMVPGHPFFRCYRLDRHILLERPTKKNQPT